MKLTDLMPVEEWIELQKAFSEKSSLASAVFDAEGSPATDAAFPCNRLCPAIKKIPDAGRQICSLAHQNMAAIAQRIHKPVIEECDAGMLKIVVPVFVEDEFIGAVGGCGRILPDSEVDVEYVQEVSGMKADDISEMASEVKSITQPEAEELASYLADRVRDIVKKAKKS